MPFLNPSSTFFRSPQQGKIFGLLLLSTSFCIALVAYRLYLMQFDVQLLANRAAFFRLRGTPTFFFLIWNLLLAWIPYLLAWCMSRCWSWRGSQMGAWLIGIVWLLFLPNAPYLLTDLLHLKSRSPIPFWYDTMLFLSFGWTGLMLGLAALYEVQLWLRLHYPKWISNSLIFISIVLSGVGVYLGR
ncbi:MAG: DUF1361 domain-containing protein, partial [Bacteroidota bacterium]